MPAPLSHQGAGTRPCIVLIHSLATRAAAWDVHADWLRRQGWRVLRYDVRGHGRNRPAEAGCSLPALADELEALLRAHAVERAHLVGISMGGMIAQQHAISHPGRVASLTLIATLGHNEAPVRRAWDERIALAREAGMGALVQPLLQRWFTPGFRAHHAGPPNRLGQWIAAMEVESFAACGAAVRDVDTLAGLRGLRVPALVIAGAEDLASPPERVALLAEALAGARFRVLPDAAHWLPLQQPQRFRAELRDFLSALPP
ncbi:alpha/beta fold hydrolase [Roseateles cavernae]|uniref:alpha/beta fold hydrolase n=1 Tax=Roseateles cavernae TaxID=3153578 RepID=UPI0032E4C6E0